MKIFIGILLFFSLNKKILAKSEAYPQYYFDYNCLYYEYEDSTGIHKLVDIMILTCSKNKINNITFIKR